MTASTTPPDLAAMFPGRAVDLGGGVTVIVKPLRYRDIRKFAERISAVIPDMLGLAALAEKKDVPMEEWGRQLQNTLGPFLLNDLLELVNDCTDADLADAPHWLLPKIITAWIEETFGDPTKLTVWDEAIRSVLAAKPVKAMVTQATKEPSTSVTPSSPSPAPASIPAGS